MPGRTHFPDFYAVMSHAQGRRTVLRFFPLIIVPSCSVVFIKSLPRSAELSQIGKIDCLNISVPNAFV